MTLSAGDSAAVNATASVGVKTPVRATAPAASGTQAHFATNGVTVVVATAEQPTISLPFAKNFTTPAALPKPDTEIGPIP